MPQQIQLSFNKSELRLKDHAKKFFYLASCS